MTSGCLMCFSGQLKPQVKALRCNQHRVCPFGPKTGGHMSKETRHIAAALLQKSFQTQVKIFRNPVKSISLSLGTVKSMFFRLFSRAPFIVMQSFIFAISLFLRDSFKIRVIFLFFRVPFFDCREFRALLRVLFRALVRNPMLHPTCPAICTVHREALRQFQTQAPWRRAASVRSAKQSFRLSSSFIPAAASSTAPDISIMP